jgi:hypothetical protein
MDEYLIKDIIKDAHEDILYILYEIRSKITYTYKKTIVLVLTSDIYSHSNLLELDKVYEKKNINNIVTI